MKAGDRFERWLVLNPYHSPAKALCQCDCGTTRGIERGSLVKGRSRSCGCLRIETTVERCTTHGMTGSRIYRVWASMIERCESPTCRDFPDYGGRYISVCPEWLHSFEQFYSDMGEPGFKGASIERVDVNGDYSPSNCIWATQVQQARNRRNSLILTHEGVSKHVNEWAEQLGVDKNSLRSRINRGWSVKDALTEPIHRRSNV